MHNLVAKRRSPLLYQLGLIENGRFEIKIATHDSKQIQIKMRFLVSSNR
jgi:hypothetical protein